MVALAFLLALASLGLGLLLSAAVRRAATALGLALFLWLVLVLFGDLGLMGTAVVLRLGPGELLALTLLNPLQGFKMAAILATGSSLEVLGPAGLYAMRTYGALLLPLLPGLLLLWAAVPLLLTALVFRHRGAR
ncbi:MAG: hypothetical protein KatS3mg131_2753 [Candidatus Tectimicrobiota bacterium]|nr:MAG: hypothetical protein KatS3mg131_2753 [Candidatus Tectomicrobia bacterium]